MPEESADIGIASPESPSSGDVILKMDNISKQFPGTLALDSVTMDVRAGEVHVLFGENGAGKSTMIQIIAGVYRQTAGSIYFKGEKISIHSVQHARDLGMSAVFQEFSLVPELSVEDNLFLGAELTRGPFLRKSALRKQARETLDRLGFPINPSRIVQYLSRAEQQMVEIAKAFRTKPSIMIFDEPTASLTERETERLFQLIEQLQTEGIGIIYITHRMNEIKRIGDRITVLRDGKYVDTIPVEEASDQKLVELMTGRVIEQIFPAIKKSAGEQILNIENLNITGDNAVNNASINVCRGEVVGLAGLVGSGKSSIGRACFGLEQIVEGKITYDGDVVFDRAARVNKLGPRPMLDRGLYYLPSNRRAEGLVMLQNVRENLSLASLLLPAFSNMLFLKKRSERAEAKKVARRLDLNPPNIERNLEHFSGGNQQKVMVGKCLVRDVKLFVFDEPTVGVDVGARVSIYEFIRELCEAGAGILLISSDLPEILHLTHRTYIMYRGSVRAELDKSEINEASVLNHFFEKGDEITDRV
ncbi:MAG: Galactose/methyl galactoside import ATP-binding protein MglA [Alphaproteobacteria bacterium MarineAlpha10_Bin1]|nr:MAG: Galactose/methyl galactoside import ATP-binding protein MglA [Alphaproteobacteria bacterium MarineAlpha10_Bin1]